MLSVHGSSVFDRLATRGRTAWGALAVPVTAFALRATAPIREPYHPERHYMRGPGPATARKAQRSHGR